MVVARTTVVTWETADGATAGQVIVEVRNDGEHTVDADLFGRGEQTVATLVDETGSEIAGQRPLQLDAVPQTLEPGEAGYLLADFEIEAGGAVATDAEITVNATSADSRPRPSLEEVSLVETDGGLGVEARLSWDGTGSAVGRVVALDSDGHPLGYVATAEVRYAAGDVSLCCFPTPVTRDAIADLESFGILLRD